MFKPARWKPVEREPDFQVEYRHHAVPTHVFGTALRLRDEQHPLLGDEVRTRVTAEDGTVAFQSYKVCGRRWELARDTLVILLEEHPFLG